MNKKHHITYRVDDATKRRLEEYASRKKWSLSQATYELVVEALNCEECADSIRQADRTETEVRQ